MKVDASPILWKRSEPEHTVYALLAGALVLLHFCFFARRDDFGVARVVGQAGSLRPIVNRPNVANVQHSSFAACRYAGQVVQPAADCQSAWPAAYNGERAGCQPAAGCHPAPRAASDFTFMSHTLLWLTVPQ
jgi:hypothetical protein